MPPAAAVRRAMTAYFRELTLGTLTHERVDQILDRAGLAALYDPGDFERFRAKLHHALDVHRREEARGLRRLRVGARRALRRGNRALGRLGLTAARGVGCGRRGSATGRSVSYGGDNHTGGTTMPSRPNCAMRRVMSEYFLELVRGRMTHARIDAVVRRAGLDGGLDEQRLARLRVQLHRDLEVHGSRAGRVAPAGQAG